MTLFNGLEPRGPWKSGALGRFKTAYHEPVRGAYLVLSYGGVKEGKDTAVTGR